LHLRQRFKKRNKRGAAMVGRGLILGRIDIVHRCKIVDAKSCFGKWELDRIIVAKLRGAITSMAKRKNKLTILLLSDGPASEATKEGIISKPTSHKKYILNLT
jgi:IS30 family transposase